MNAPTVYWEDEHVTLYVGDMREVLPTLGINADLVIADPPYAETSLEWDRWPDDWPVYVSAVASSMWCFGSLRMFGLRWSEFHNVGWKMSQDIVWEKANGTGFAADRFKRVHEVVTHWYRGDWAAIHHETPRMPYSGPDKTARGRTSRTPHTGTIGAYHYRDDGTRLARSVQYAPSVRGGIHPTEKPPEILRQLVAYGCPEGGLVLDPFAGSGSTLEAARLTGRRAIGIEAHEPYAEAAARRLAQAPLELA